MVAIGYASACYFVSYVYHGKESIRHEQSTSCRSNGCCCTRRPVPGSHQQQKRLAISLISGCHTLNHLQYSITSVIFPVIMKELGFGLLQLGMLSAISNFVGQGLQVIYGFFAGFSNAPSYSASAT